MANLIEWIEEEANGEEIEGVVIGEMGYGDLNSKIVPKYKKQPKGVLLSWDEAKKWLDYEFVSSFGMPECNAICAWTISKVITVGQYDGVTWVYSLPRNPIDYMPKMEGG